MQIIKKIQSYPCNLDKETLWTKRHFGQRDKETERHFGQRDKETERHYKRERLMN